MELLIESVGPLATNCVIAADSRTGEAIAVDTAIPSLDFVRAGLQERGWTLKLIVSTHGHWDHIGDNAAVAEHTGAPIAVHPLDRDRLLQPAPLSAPFEIPPCVPAVELAEGGESASATCASECSTRRVTPRARSACTRPTMARSSPATRCSPGAGAGSICRADRPSDGRVPGAPGRLEDRTRVIPGHGAPTTIGRERAWLEQVVEGRSAPRLNAAPRPGGLPRMRPDARFSGPVA